MGMNAVASASTPSMRQVEMTLVKHPRNARRIPQDSVSHAEPVLLALWEKKWPRDDVDLVGDLSDAPTELFQSQPRAAIQQAILRAHVVEVKRRLHCVFGTSVVRGRREVASVIARMLVVREPRPQSGRHIRGLEVLGISAAWRVLGLGIEPLLRQSFDHPQRIARPLVEIHDVVFVVARAMAYWSAVLECRVAWRRRRAAADPSGCGTRRNMPGAPHEAARCTALFTSLRAS